MSESGRRVLFIAVGMLISCSAGAFSAGAFDLNGAWSTNEENCSKMFVTENNKLTMTRNSDVFGSGFIADGNQLRGPAKACKIINRKEAGDVLHLVISCTTDIAVLGTQEVSAKINNDNQVTRIYAEFPEMGISFFRCKL